LDDFLVVGGFAAPPPSVADCKKIIKADDAFNKQNIYIKKEHAVSPAFTT
jgi:hypothetical protein